VLTVWGRKNSVNVQKVLWCLAELGVEYERIDAGLEFGLNTEPWYLALNPNGRIPLVRDGDATLWESNSIVRYLCAKHSPGRLYPEDPARRAEADRWMDWQLSTLARPTSIAFWNLVRRRPAERDEAAVARAVPEANAAFDILDRHLGIHAYVAGPELTMGDIPVGAMAHRSLALEGIERPSWPALERWYGSLRARPPFRAHVAQPLS
jgi:glutathione S-transferase